MTNKTGKLFPSNYRFSESERAVLRRIADKLAKTRKKRVSDNQVLREALECFAGVIL